MRTSQAYNNSPAAPNEKTVNSSSACPYCGGEGWRPIIVDGDRRVVRCACRRPRPGFKGPVLLPDHKSAAAGDR